MFDDRVYKRGALTLHALRLMIGDVAFFGLLPGVDRDAPARHRDDGRLHRARRDADRARDFGSFFEAWLYRPGAAAPAGGGHGRITASRDGEADEASFDPPVDDP